MAKLADQNDITVGRNIRALRIAAGMSQERLGELLGITFQQVQKYEKGTNRVSASRIVRICHALGCGIESVFAGIDVPGAAGSLPVPDVSRRAMRIAGMVDSLAPRRQSALLQLVESMLDPAPLALVAVELPAMEAAE